MNKTNQILLGLVAVFAMVSCQDATNPINSLTVSSKCVEFGCQPADPIAVDVSASAEWNAEFDGEAAQWLSFTKDGNKLVLTASANSSILDREARLNVISSGRKIAVNVSQSGIPVTVTLDVQSVKAEVGGKTQVINVDSNIDWVIDSDEDWVTCTPSEGKSGKTAVTVTIPENKYYETRTSKLGFYYSLQRFATVEIEQDPFIVEFSLDKEKVEAAQEAGTAVVKLSSNYAWTASTTDNWITVSPLSGQAGNDQEISISYGDAQPEERSAAVTFVAGNVTKTLAVHQDKAKPNPINISVVFADGTKAYQPFTTNLKSSVAQSYNLGVLDYILKETSYKFSIYSSYSGSLINKNSGLITLPYKDDVYTLDIREEAFGFVQVPAIKGYVLTSVSIVSGPAASSIKFPLYVTPTYGTSNAEAIAAAVGTIEDIGRGKTTSVTLKNPVANTAYYLFMPPQVKKTSAYQYLMFQINLVYDPE